MASLSFDASTVAPQATPTPIPAGTYTVAVVDSDVKPTKSGGLQAVFTLQVADGEFTGRKVFARLNVRNPSPQAEQIGQAQLSALLHACGVIQMQDTAQLHGKVLRARVVIRKDETGQYGDQNEVKGFEALAGGMPAFGAQQAAPAAQTKPASGAAVPPWKKAAA